MKKPKLGQHFLTNEQVVKEIVSAAQLQPSDTVLEVGPGKGILTRHLANTGAQVIAVEKDGELHHKLKKTFKDYENVKLIHDDIRSFSLNTLPTNYAVVANIPYYLTGQLIKMLVESENPPAKMVMMIQKEVAQRLVADKGASNLLQLTTSVFAESEIISEVPKEDFSPPPEVDSAVIKLIRRPAPLVEKGEQKAFFRLLKFAFSGKRKKIVNTLSASLKIDKNQLLDCMKKCQVGENARPQELGVEEWICVYKELGKTF